MHIERQERAILTALPFRKNEVWQGDIVRLPSAHPSAKTGRYAVVWSIASTGKTSECIGRAKESIGADDLILAFIALAKDKKTGGHIPGKVQVRSAAHASELMATLGPLGIEVSAKPALAVLDQTIADWRKKYMVHGRDLFAGRGMTRATVERIGDSLRALIESRVVSEIDGYALFRIAPHAAVVHEFVGLRIEESGGGGCSATFYRNAAQVVEFERMLREKNRDPRRSSGTPIWTIVTVPRSLAGPFGESWDDLDLAPLPRDFVAAVVEEKNMTSDAVPDVREAESIAVILAAVARTTAEDLARAEWKASVVSGDRTIELELGLPDVNGRIGGVDDRLTEGFRSSFGAGAAVQVGLFDHLCSTMKNAGREADAQSILELRESISPDSSPSRRMAFELHVDAQLVSGVAARVLLERAMSADPTFVDACLLHMCQFGDPVKDAAAWKALAGELNRLNAISATIGEAGDTSTIFSTRYAKLLKSRADHALRRGATVDALSDLLEIRRACRGDFGDVRLETVAILIQVGRPEEASDLLHENFERASSLDLLLSSLLAFQSGRIDQARSEIASWVSFLPDAWKYITAANPSTFPTRRLSALTRKADVFPHIVAAWLAVPGAQSFLRTAFTSTTSAS